MPLKNQTEKNGQVQALFSAYNIIQKKRDGKKLSKEEINWFIQGILTGETADYQMASWLMAVYLKGMSVDETAWLTDAMLYSGEVLQFEGNDVVDKHSTGGVGDKTSFILAPIAKACGVKVPMMAGRGLGHTGGTVDKIECIPGFKTELSMQEFKQQVLKYGLVLIGQTQTLAPADKKIYGLRDVTATIESIPLITSSIMSKKLAEGAHGIVMDVKTGDGAFMKKTSEAKKLAQSLRFTASRFNRKMITFITDMSQPLGNAIGHTTEIIESIETLKGKGPKDLTEISLRLAAAMVFLAGKAKNQKEAYQLCHKALYSGAALEEFRQMVIRQGGDISTIDNLDKLPMAQEKTVVTSVHSGFVRGIKGTLTGLACVSLGGGRTKSTDKIDMGVGFLFHKKIGDQVKKNDPLITIFHHASQKSLVQKITRDFQQNIFQFSTRKIPRPKLILETKMTKGKK